MRNKTKTPVSEALIRFPDCDPFRHLNNSRYLDYFMNAREDHLIQEYDFNIHHYTHQTGKGWVVAQSQIAYLRPVMLLETVCIQSSLLRLGEKDLLVEMQMLDKERNIVKALLWAQFFHIDLKTGKPVPHPENLIEFFTPLQDPIEGNPSFDDRARMLRTAQR